MILQRYCLVFILPYLANSINFIKDNYVQTRVSSYTYTQLPIKKKEKNKQIKIYIMELQLSFWRGACIFLISFRPPQPRQKVSFTRCEFPKMFS